VTNRLPLLKLALALAFAFTLVVLPGVGSGQVRAAPAAAPTLTDPRYFVGANVPWINWTCDFGCGDKGGASSVEVRATLAEGFGQLKAAGIHTVRWWVFEGDPWQITRDSSGNPAELSPAVYTDLDAALALAAEYDLVYDFVLFSSATAPPRGWITDPKQRHGLADALAPLFEHYKDHQRILAWELFNEPEWDIWNNKISPEPVQATVKLLAATIHAHTTTAVTVGSATLEGLPLWVNQGLNFYSPHWYDQMGDGNACARCTDAAAAASLYKLYSVPIVIGEFYAGPDTDGLQRFRDLRSRGYAGAWAWSLFSDRTGDKMRIDLAAAGTPGTTDPAVAAAVPAASVVAGSSVHLLANWVSPTYVSPGQTITFHQDALSTRETAVLVDFEVYDAAGQKISQTALDNQVLLPNGVASFSTTMALPASLPPGQYTVKAGLCSPDWSTLYVWSDLAGAFVVDTVNAPAPVPASEGTEPG